MILDSSAIVAIFLAEPGASELLERLGRAARVAVGAPTLAETTIVLSARMQRDARGLVARFLAEAAVTVVPFGEEHLAAAVDAWLRYGRGRHVASLNLGDCFSYATASLAREPLLCVGDDFAKTDLEIA